MSKRITIIKGGLAVDGRGTVRFVNDFNFKDVKRFYQVENFSTSTIRAFHGHFKEAKYVFVISGSILMVVVSLNKIKSPSKKARVKRLILSSTKPHILFIPPKYAHGYKALESNTKIIFFSTLSLKKSKKDDFRYPSDYWGKEIWKIENR